MKRFLSMMLVITLCLITTTTAFAAEPEADNSEIDYMNYDFPADAKVIYQGEEGVIYQTHETTTSARTMQYNGVWISAGKQPMGTFGITNPHTLVKTTEGTFKIESEYSGAKAQMILRSGTAALANKTLTAKDGDVRFSFKSNTKNLTVHYFVQTHSNVHGMRLMCWLW